MKKLWERLYDISNETTEQTAEFKNSIIKSFLIKHGLEDKKLKEIEERGLYLEIKEKEVDFTKQNIEFEGEVILYKRIDSKSYKITLNIKK